MPLLLPWLAKTGSTVRCDYKLCQSLLLLTSLRPVERLLQQCFSSDRRLLANIHISSSTQLMSWSIDFLEPSCSRVELTLIVKEAQELALHSTPRNSNAYLHTHTDDLPSSSAFGKVCFLEPEMVSGLKKHLVLIR